MASEPEANKISMADIGSRLKEAREKKAVTIDQAQKQTHIHSTVLTALEEGRLDEMLTPTYVKSFLKKYASYLGLYLKKMGEEYSLIHGERPPRAIPSIALSRPEPKESADLSGLLHVLKNTVVFVAVIVLAAFLGGKTLAFLKKAKTPSRPKAAAQKQVKAAPEKKAVAIAKSAPLELIIKAKQPVMVQLKKDGDILFKRVLPKGAKESFTAGDSFNLYIAKAEALELVLNGKSLGSPGKGVIKNLEITRKGIRIK